MLDAADITKKPKIYDCEIRREGNVLKLRGKLLFIGGVRDWEYFDPAHFPAGFDVPDYIAFLPSIAVVR